MKGRGLAALLGLGVALVAAQPPAPAEAAVARSPDGALAQAALLRVSDLPSGWSSVEGSTLVPVSRTGPAKAACQATFDNAAMKRATVLRNAAFHGQGGLPTVDDAVYLFPSAELAEAAYAGIKGPPLVHCLSAIFGAALPAGTSFTVGSSYRSRVVVRGRPSILYGIQTSVEVFGIPAPVRFESVTVMHGRALATLFFASDLSGQQVPTETALISLAASRLP